MAVAAAGPVLLAALRPQLSRRLDESVVRLTHPVAVMASALVAGALQLLVFAPVAIIARLLGNDPLGTAKAGSYWVDRQARRSRDLSRRQFAVDVTAARTGSPTGGLGRPVKTTVVVVTSALVLNLVGGLAWERAGRLAGRPPGPHRGAVEGTALAGQPWMAELDAEAARMRAYWDPLMGPVRKDHTGRHINTHSLARRTFAPPSGAGHPQVFFFGGSAMFGYRQRDLHTIPSEVARLAAADGHPIDAVNYGQTGWVIWQEVELLERLLTTGHVPDVAVFYNGANEVSAQVAELSDQPSIVQAPEARRRLEGNTLARAADSVYGWYAGHSAVHRLRNRLQGGPPAPPAPPAALTAARAANAAHLHQRAVAVIERLAAGYGFRAAYFWQPTRFDKDRGETGLGAGVRADQLKVYPEDWGGAYQAATAQITSPVVDLTDALDEVSEPVFFDRVHTNERGAAVVAAAMYAPVAAAVAGP